jgi:polyhydroxyalkanoate synthesis regulator phasin
MNQRTKNETHAEKLARLEHELDDLKAKRPEHCYGSQGYVSAHATSPTHWQKIEDLEEEIAKLKAEVGR